MRRGNIREQKVRHREQVENYPKITKIDNNSTSQRRRRQLIDDLENKDNELAINSESFLIHFNCGKYLSCKPEASHGTDHTKDHEHTKANEEHVSKVQQIRHEHTRSFQLSEPDNRVAKGPNGSRTRAKEGVPPPTVILRTELVVHEQHRDLGTRDNHNKVDNESETKDVVELVHPQTGHDEE